MSFETEQKALGAGQRLARRLNKSLGGKWETRVHENIGWHVSVRLNAVSVSIYKYADGLSYGCLVSDDPRYPGTGAGTWSKDKSTYKNPEDAVLHSLRVAHEEFKKIEKFVIKDTVDMLSRSKKAIVKSESKMVFTNDDFLVKEGSPIWYVNGSSTHKASLRIGYHDVRYKFFKLKKNAIEERRSFTTSFTRKLI